MDHKIPNTDIPWPVSRSKRF